MSLLIHDCNTQHCVFLPLLWIVGVCVGCGISEPGVSDVSDMVLVVDDAALVLDVLDSGMTGVDSVMVDTVSVLDVLDSITSDVVADVSDSVLMVDVVADGLVAADADVVYDAPDGMILIPSGTFWMGCNEFKNNTETDWQKQCYDHDKPQHEVTLSAYWIDETEVTVSAYKKCVASGVCTVPECAKENLVSCNYVFGKDEQPINDVTWCQAKAHCEWTGGRLPTEAEWEMAAAGSCVYNSGEGSCKKGMRLFPWGDELATCEYAVMEDNDESGWGCGGNDFGIFGMNVGSKPNGNSPYGVKDLSGNMWEWVEDCDGAYSEESVKDPLASSSCKAPDFENDCDVEGGNYRVMRGGSFVDYAKLLRVSSRDSKSPGYTAANFGFRCARSIPQNP